MMTWDAFHRAYFAPPIASLMATFQDGLHFDMLAMLNLQLPPHLSRCNYPNAAYARLANFLDPWLLEFGLSRLSRLFECLEEMHAITLLHATYSGRVDVVDVALNHRGVTPAMMLLLIDVAAWKNQRRVLDFFQRHPHASGWTCSSFALVAAAREGHLDIVQFLHEHFPTVPSTEDAMDMAGEFGHLDVVQYLHANRSDGCTTRAMDYAAEHGHFDVLRFLHAHRSEGCTEQAMELACEHGHLDVAQWLVEHRSKEGISEKAFDLAAGNNHMAVVEFLHRLQALSTEKAMNLAAGNGHLSMVQWLHQHRPLQGCTEEAMDKAAVNGHLEVVKWLHENRSEGGTSAGFFGAARGGHLEVLKWLVANRSDEVCTERALQAAVEATRVDVVEWLLNWDHDGPMRVVVMVNHMNGYTELIQLLQQYRPTKMVIAGTFLLAVRGGDLNVIERMFNRGGHDASALDEAASCGHLHVVQWLHARSFPATTYAMDYACRNGHLHVIRWLHRNRTEGCSRSAMTAAIDNGHFSIVMWLHRHRMVDISDFSTHDSARSGDLTMVEYLHMHHAVASSTLNTAITGGHFPVVQFLHHHRPEAVSRDDLNTAVVCGYLALAKWLVATCHITIARTTLNAAVESGDLTILTWVLGLWDDVVDFDRPWLAALAARDGRLSLVQYLKESWWEWTEHAMDCAAANGHLAVLVALQAHGLRCSSNTVRCAVRGGHVQVVRWLQLNGCNGCAIDEAAGRGMLAMVAYLYNELCPASSKTVLEAAKGDAVHVVKWLVSHGVSCTAEVLAWAEQHPTYTSAKWLLAHRATLQGSSAPAEPKRRKISHDHHHNDGHCGGDVLDGI